MQTVRYALFGISASAVSLAVYLLQTRLFDFDLVAANLTAWLVSNIYSFRMNRTVVFHVDAEEEKSELSGSVSGPLVNPHFIVFLSCVEFLFSRLFSCLIETLVMALFIDTFGFNDIAVRVCVVIILGLIEYIFDKFVLFNGSLFKVPEHKPLFLHK